MAYKSQSPPAGANGSGLQRSEQGGQENSTLEFSPLLPTCQTFKLSVDSLTRIAFLAGDLGCFYLRKCHDFVNFPDPAFNEPFSKACELLAIEDVLLRRAAELELLEARR